MKLLESLQFRKGGYEGGMHVVVLIGHQLVQRPEGVLLRGEVHQQEGGHLGHALAVAHLRVEHAVGRQHVEQVLLARVIPRVQYVTRYVPVQFNVSHYRLLFTVRESRNLPFPEHDVIPVGSVDIKIYLSDVGAKLSGQLLHLLVFPRLLLLDPVQVKQDGPQAAAEPLWHTCTVHNSAVVSN